MLVALFIPSLYLSFSTRSQKVLLYYCTLKFLYCYINSYRKTTELWVIYSSLFAFSAPAHTQTPTTICSSVSCFLSSASVKLWPSSQAGWPVVRYCTVCALLALMQAFFFVVVVKWKSAVKPLYLLREPQFTLVLPRFESLSFITSFCLLHQRALYPLQGRVSTAIHSGPLLAGCISQGEQFLFLYWARKKLSFAGNPFVCFYLL